MTFLDRISRALVIAPHPDDEILGCGGTIARLTRAGADVQIAIATRGREPRFARSAVEQVANEALAAHQSLGISATHWLNLPAVELDTIPQADINAALCAVIEQVEPDTVFLPFAGDIHLDHRIIFESALVAMRPLRQVYPRRILAYETLSETNWSTPCATAPFVPNLSVDIADTLANKLDAFRCYASQQTSFPHERSIEALQALATLRGATVHRRAAEAFLLIREVA